METRNYWEENGHTVKYDNYNSNDGFSRVGGEQLNFAAPSEDEGEYPPGAYLKKGKVSRQDPMSHRIIEKRRRDRMNNCLADLSRLIPPEYLKKGRGRVEKTEIIEMAIRHLKFLQERVSAAERGSQFRAGYQEAAAAAVRFLVDAQGFGPGDALCVQLAAHLHAHCEILTKGEAVSSARDKSRSHQGSSSETASSSSSSHGFAVKVIQRPEPPPAFLPEPYEAPEQAYSMECDRDSLREKPSTHEPGRCSSRVPEYQLEHHGPKVEPPYTMECDRVPVMLEAEAEAEAAVKHEPALRKVRKPDADYLHSYKFKNSIERRFSRSQDSEASSSKVWSHKRRRAGKPPPASASASSHCTSGSGSTEDARDTSPQDTSSESPHHHQYDKPPPPTQYVPVFALNALGKYYVPLSVDYACVSRQLGALELAAPLTLHPVTIHVNFAPCIHPRRTKRAWPA